MLEEIQTPVKKELDIFNKMVSETMMSGNQFIDTVLNHILEAKGKQLRPLLTLLTGALNGEINSRTYTSALLVEMTHISSLVHDDVIDEAFLRRGQLAANAIWRSKNAVLIGDYMISRAMTTASRNDALAELSVVISALEELTQGELIQMEHSSKLDMTKDLYFSIIEKKTASLLGACACVGAMSVGASQEIAENMKLMGRYIGSAFQIKDDILDYTSIKTGKPLCTDIKERKITLPMLALLEESSAAVRKDIIRKISDIRDNNVDPLRNMVLNSGAIAKSEKEMELLRDKALAILSTYPESPAKKSIELFCEFILRREH